MAELTLQEKKQLILNAITTIDQITNEVKDNYPFDDEEQVITSEGEPWDAQNYKSFLIRKLGAIEYELQNTEEDTTNTEEESTTTEETTNTQEGNEEQVTQQEQDNKEEEEEVKQ